jgi:leucyl aminopeptidase
MKFAFIFLFVAGLLGTSSAHAAKDNPVKIWKGVSKLAPVNPNLVIYSDVNSVVIKEAAAKETDFDNVFVVNFYNWFAEPEWINEYGEMLAFEPGRYGVMRLLPEKTEELSARLHQLGFACGVLVKLSGDPVVLEAAVSPVPVIPVTTREVRVENAVAKVSADNIKANIEWLSNIHTRHHASPTGQQIADLLAEKYETFRMGRNDVSITTYSHGTRTGQKSLIVRIEGKTRPSEVIVLGSHLDSIAMFGGRSPGADDNASGTSTNMEVFRVLMEDGIALDRTLEIHAYAAEEIGLIGSQDIATKYKNDGVNVVSMVQHDMTLWKAEGTEDKIWFVTNNTESGLTDMLTKLVDSYVGLPWAKANLSGGSSDHASWTRAGFAAAFPFENPTAYNRHIHTANDTIQNANAFNQAAGFAKLGISYAAHFGGLN